MLLVVSSQSTTDSESTINLFKCLLLDSDVTSIGFQAFYGCSKLENVVFPSRLELLGNDAFYGCASIKNVFLPDSLRTIERACFNNCGCIDKVVLSKNLKIIGDEPFSQCDIKEISLVEGMEDDKVLRFITSIGNLYLPSTVKNINACLYININNVQIDNNNPNIQCQECGGVILYKKRKESNLQILAR